MAELVELDELENIAFTQDTQKSVTEKETLVPEEDKSRHYVDDDKLTEVLGKWSVEYKEQKLLGLPTPTLPKFVCECIIKIIDAIGKRHNYIGYSYLDEMKSDALLNNVKYIHNFNPQKKNMKGKNSAFTYINFISIQSFNNRIEYEKEQQYLKYISYGLLGGNEAFGDEIIESDDSEEGGTSVSILGNEFMNKALEYEADKEAKKKQKIKKPTKKSNTFMFDLFEEELQETEEFILFEGIAV